MKPNLTGVSRPIGPDGITDISEYKQKQKEKEIRDYWDNEKKKEQEEDSTKKKLK